MLLDDDEPDMDANHMMQREMLAAVLRSGHKMAQIIEELLLLAQVRRAEVSHTVVDMAEIIRSASARRAAAG